MVTFVDEKMYRKRFDEFSYADELHKQNATTSKAGTTTSEESDTTGGAKGKEQEKSITSYEPSFLKSIQAQQRRGAPRQSNEPEYNPPTKKRRIETSESNMIPPNTPQEYFEVFSHKEVLRLQPCSPGSILPAETISFLFKAPRFETNFAMMTWMLDPKFDLYKLLITEVSLAFLNWCRDGWLLVFDNERGQILRLPSDSSSIQLPTDMTLPFYGILFDESGTGCFALKVETLKPSVPIKIPASSSQASSSNSIGSSTPSMNPASSCATSSYSQQQLRSFNSQSSQRTLDQSIEQRVTDFVESGMSYDDFILQNSANLNDRHSTGFTLQDMIYAFSIVEDEESDDLQDLSEACSPTTSPEPHSPSVSPPFPTL